MSFFGLGKPYKTRFGEYLGKKGIKATWLAKESKVSRATLNKLINEPDYQPSGTTMKKIMKVINKEFDKNKKSSDFLGF